MNATVKDFRVSWKRINGKIELKIKVPRVRKAHLELPDVFQIDQRLGPGECAFLIETFENSKSDLANAFS